jgi:predicted ester cyclase
VSAPTPTPGPAADGAESAALVRRIYEMGFNGGTPAIYDECYWPDFLHHSKIDFEVDPGAAGEKQSMFAFRAAIPDVRFEILDLLAEGERVAARLRITGTTVVAYASIPAGTALDIHAMALFRVVGGRAAEEWFFVDGGH